MKLKISQDIGIALPIVLIIAIIAYNIGSIIVLRGCIGVLFVLCIILGRREGMITNPFFLFCFTPLSLLIYTNISQAYMMDLEAKTWFIAIINCVAYIFGLTINSKQELRIVDLSPNNGKPIRTVTVLFLIAGLFPTFFQLIFRRPFFLGSVLVLLLTPAIVCAIKSKSKVLIILTIASTILSSISDLSKTTVLSIIIAAVVSYERYYQQGKRSKWHSFGLVMVGGAVLLLSFTLGGEDAEQVLSYYVRYGNVKWKNNAVAFMPYMYITTPWTNLQHVLQTQDTRTYGLWMLKPILGYFQLENKFSEFYRFQAYSSFNTSTFIACHFKDFGYYGSVIPSVLLGIMSRKVYQYYKYSNSPLDIACYVLWAQAILEMFFSNHFFRQSYPFTIIILMWIAKKVLPSLGLLSEKRELEQ